MNNVVQGKFRKKYFDVKQSDVSTKIMHLMEERVKNGAKHLAISSTGYSSSQQKLALQFIHYLNQKYPVLKIGVVSFECETGYFKEFYSYALGKKPMKNFYNHFSLIDWKAVASVDSLSDRFDVLIWDLPELSTLKSRFAKLDELFKSLQMLTIVSCQKAGSREEEFVMNIIKAYRDYGFDVSNLIQFQDLKKRSLFDSINQLLRRSLNQ